MALGYLRTSVNHSRVAFRLLEGDIKDSRALPFVLERDFGKTIVGFGEALFDVSDGRRVFLGNFLAFALVGVAVALRFLLLQLL